MGVLERKKTAMALTVTERRFCFDKPYTWWKKARKSGSSTGKVLGFIELEADLTVEGASSTSRGDE